ncbi:MAG: ethanolamine ammonia-lyase subunit EutC [Rhodoferax sp.]|nr:ethanolamine ammonia-lyase subunit EutC [Rhodoferax sp.]
MKTDEPVVIASPWNSLRRFTDARIALGRAGHSLPTAAHLGFQLAHAQARDAVHLAFDALGVSQSIEALGLPTLSLHSAATDRNIYLQRPDLGRKLDVSSRQLLAASPLSDIGNPLCDVAFVVADGLSALAIHQNAVPLLSAILSRLRADAGQAWSIGPVAVVQQGRVAVADEIGELLGAKTVVILIGERPGLSSPDSMGLYLTWEPRVGRNDSQRNCISNVRPAGLSAEAAATKLHYLLSRSRTLCLSGVELKDEAQVPATDQLSGQ